MLKIKKMSNFRIIAIKTGSNGISPRNFLKTSKHGVDIDYLKNLIPNTIYSFYNNYIYAVPIFQTEISTI